jgi:hypothetical protein
MVLSWNAPAGLFASAFAAQAFTADPGEMERQNAQQTTRCHSPRKRETW